MARNHEVLLNYAVWLPLLLQLSLESDCAYFKGRPIVFDLSTPYKEFQLRNHGSRKQGLERSFQYISDKSMIYLKTETPSKAFHIQDVRRELNVRFGVHTKVLIEYTNFDFSILDKFIEDYDDTSSNVDEFNTTMGRNSFKGATGIVFTPVINRRFKMLRTEAIKDSIQNLKNGLSSDVSIGFGYNESNLGDYSILPLINVVDFLVITVEFGVQEHFVESYDIFKDRMNSVVDKNGIFVNLENSRVVTVYSLRLLPSLVVQDPRVEEKYFKLLEQFGRRWSAEREVTVVIDGIQFRVNLNESIMAESSHPGKATNVIPSLVRIPFYEIGNWSAVLAKISTTFPTLHVDFVTWEFLGQNYHGTRVNNLTDFPLDQPLSVIVEITEVYTLEELTDIANKIYKYAPHLQTRNFTLSTIAFRMDPSKFGDTNINSNSKLTFPEGVPIACIVELDTSEDIQPVSIFAQTQTKCFWRPSLVIWVLPVDFIAAESYGFGFTYYIDQIQSQLSKILVARNELVDKHPDIKVFLKLEHSSLPWNSDRRELNDEVIRTFYCQPVTQKINQYMEAMVTWAEIHRFPILLKNAFESSSATLGWWKPLKTWNGILDDAFESFPYYVLRNYPENFNGWKTDPCVKWSGKVNLGGVPVQRGPLGVTMETHFLKNRRLQKKELEVMLDFLLWKFPVIEVILGKDDSETFFHALNSLSGRPSLLNSTLYIELNSGIDVDDYLKLKEQMRKLTPKISGIHFPLNSTFENGKQKLHSLQKQTNIPIGITLNDCDKRIREFLHPGHVSPTIPKVNYIVCDIQPVTASNEDKRYIAEYFDSHLYIKKVFQRFFPNVEIFFRLNLHSYDVEDDRENDKHLLRFFNDLQQFSENNGVKYFMVKAFAEEKEISWWRIGNYSDLGNATIYTERESSFLNRTTWRPQAFPKYAIVGSSVPGISTELIITIGLAIFLIFICIITCLIVKVRRQSWLLSNSEINEFLNGANDLPNNQEASSGAHPVFDKMYRYINMKYDAKYDFPKSAFNLDRSQVIGMGHFGQVYKATLNEEQAAVKVPHEHCSKMTFKSMLSEVKVMSYLGEHTNVIRFLGCYIKEIRQGVIYIATVLCENGSLLLYLRQMQCTPTFMRELVTFSFEIASGMDYVSSKNIVHGDLSTRNILLNSFKTCKICDFGLARKLYDYQKYVKNSQEPLPWRWMAYESLKRMEFTTKSDVWSYGVTLWEIFSLGDIPYPGLVWNLEFVEELHNGLRMKSPQHCSKEIYGKILDCWTIEPDRRPTFAELQTFFLGLIYTNLCDP